MRHVAGLAAGVLERDLRGPRAEGGGFTLVLRHAIGC